MLDFFISYAPTDQSWAEWIAWQLEAEGHTTLIKAWDSKAGGNFVLEMQQGASQSKRTVAVISPDYLTSGLTQPEWATAFAQDPTGEQGKLLPVRVRECDPTGLLAQIRYIDLVGLDEAKACAALSTQVKQKRLKPTYPPHFPGKKSAQPAFPGPTEQEMSRESDIAQPRIDKANDRGNAIGQMSLYLNADQNNFHIRLRRFIVEDFPKLTKLSRLALEEQSQEHLQRFTLKREDDPVVVIDTLPVNAERLEVRLYKLHPHDSLFCSSFYKWVGEVYEINLRDKAYESVLSSVGELFVLDEITFTEQKIAEGDLFMKQYDTPEAKEWRKRLAESVLNKDRPISFKELEPPQNLSQKSASPIALSSSLASLYPNPFVAGPMITDPRIFVGRKDILQGIITRMVGVQPTSVNIVGERRIGKSSLLYYFFKTWEQHVEQPNRYVVIYLSLQDAQCRRESDFYEAVAKELLNRPVVQTQTVLVNTLKTNPLNRMSFAQAIRQWRDAGVLPVLCLDEFEALLEKPEEFGNEFYDSLRTLMNNNALMLIMASREKIEMHKDERMTSDFFNVGHVLTLGNLTAEESDDLMRLPASTVSNAHTALSLADQRRARKWGGQHPCLLQLAASVLCQARQQRRDEHWAWKEFKSQADHLNQSRHKFDYRLWWRALSRVFFGVPAFLGKIAKWIGGLQDDLSNWIIGMIVLIMVILVILGFLSGSHVLELIRKALGG